MTESNPQQLGLMPKLVVVLGILLVAAGVLWHAIRVEVLGRLRRTCSTRRVAPISFRFILQPLMSAIVAIHDSVKDARTGRLRHFWTVAGNPREPANRPSRDSDGRDLLVPGIQNVLSGSGVAHRPPASLYSLPADPLAGHTYRALVARQCLGRNQNESVCVAHSGRIRRERTGAD